MSHPPSSLRDIRTLTLGHSPDSDDAFMFYALAAGRIDTDGYTYEHILKDIQTLNEWAKEGRLDTTAISVHAYAYVAGNYAVLTHGASMGGADYGPLVVARSAARPQELRGKKIAVPGLLTSAYLALRLRVGEFEPEVMPFDRIMEAVASGRSDFGLLIHEGQLTHAELGLSAILNLGTWWHESTGLPLPLGVNAIRRSLSPDVKKLASRHLRESIEYGLAHRQEALEWALRYARGMKTETADAFVGMYVNDRTVDLGTDGRESIQLFLDRAAREGFIPDVGRVEFVS
ncbi:MAG: ABC transporter substrate-binding protein [Candidatus Eremiobacter antarcticus]|nr:ABC transporter substrate-binding protein [Candidatus Eremiobacteraeota bacterium]MBC5808714.1 ABC transporter substrate-binding protein [Candidatus Eremiobacteraeota bacterium]PZR62192.1 MAG: ABC transporter substrate-binding protein [Candidatus Eremiobacter sp. RRmetagenome_bin22]